MALQEFFTSIVKMIFFKIFKKARKAFGQPIGRFSRNKCLEEDSQTDSSSSHSQESWLERTCGALRRNELRDLEIDYAYHFYDGAELSEISEALHENTSVTRLVLRNLELHTSENMAHIHSMLEETNSIKTLRLEDSGEMALLEIVRFLTVLSTTVETLHLKGNVVCPDGARAIAAMLSRNESLTHFGFCHNGITEEGFSLITGGLKANRSLTSLDFLGNGITDVSVAKLCDALKYNQSVEYLCLDFNNFSHIGVSSIATLLEQNSTLEDLHLFGNRIDSRGAESLGRALRVNSSLDSLILSFNQIGDSGVIALGEALTVNRTLSKLWFPSNYINDEGLRKFATFLPRMKGLRELFVGDVFEIDVASSFADGLELNTSIHNLYMESPIYGDECYVEDKINYYLRLNRCGRQLLHASQPVALGLWSEVLANAGEEGEMEGGPDVLYYLMRQRPDLLQRI